MREFRTSGSVRGEGGEILAYSACGLMDLAAFIKMVKARISVCLQGAAECAQVLARMFALAVRCIGEPDGRRRIKTGRTIIAHIGP